ncbi:MAG: hypothetical protein IE931_03135 [Sphingobacteriales bacterium]|nr:hypothetical protein [Sphingobacteriales bacterium]
MKSKFRIALIVAFLLATFSQTTLAQKFIKLDAQLKANSKPMPAKRKGFTDVGRYQFGNYQVISGKSGWTKTTTKSPLFQDNTTTNSSTKKSFVFVDHQADTANANIQIRENIKSYNNELFARTFLNWNRDELLEGKGIFETDFKFSTNTSAWKLAVIYPLALEKDGRLYADYKTPFKGILTNNKTYIEIREVTQNEEGKKSFLSPVLGYEFWLDSESLAAVQVVPMSKMNVWIKEDLDPKLKFILASGAAALLIKTQ